MGLCGKKSRGPTIRIPECSEEAVKRFWLWLVDHHEAKAEIELRSTEGYECPDADRRDPRFPRTKSISEQSMRAVAIGHRATFTGLRERRCKHLTVLMNDRPFIDEAFILRIEPPFLTMFRNPCSWINMN